MDFYRRLLVKWWGLVFDLGKRYLGTVFFAIAGLAIGSALTYRLFPGEPSIVAGEVNSHVKFWWPTYLLLGLLAILWQFVVAAKRVDDETQKSLNAAAAEREEAKSSRARLLERLSNTEAGRDRFSAESAWRLKLNSKETLWYRAHELTPKNLSIFIRYCPGDQYRRLADSIAEAFKGASSGHLVVPWKIEGVKPTSGELDNPTDKSKVVLFSNDDSRDMIAAALSELLDLKGEMVVKAWQAREDQPPDSVEVVIFDHKKKYD